MYQMASTCFSPKLDFCSITPYEFIMEKIELQPYVHITKHDTLRMFRIFTTGIDVLTVPTDYSRLASLVTSEFASTELTNFNNVLLTAQYVGKYIDPVNKPTPFVFEAMMQDALECFLVDLDVDLTTLMRQHMFCRFAAVPGLFKRASEVSWKNINEKKVI